MIEGSTTILAIGVKPQEIGGRNGLPLTRNGEGEEIVWSHMKVWGA